MLNRDKKTPNLRLKTRQYYNYCHILSSIYHVKLISHFLYIRDSKIFDIQGLKKIVIQYDYELVPSFSSIKNIHKKNLKLRYRSKHI